MLGGQLQRCWLHDHLAQVQAAVVVLSQFMHQMVSFWQVNKLLTVAIALFVLLF